MPRTGSHEDAEPASFDKNARASILAVDDTTTNKTRKIMTFTRGGKNYLLVDEEEEYTVKYDYAGGSDIIYTGEAAAGTATSTAEWRIKKYTYSGSDITDIQWADGVNTFTKEWDERTNYSYS